MVSKITRDVPDIPNPGRTSRHYQEFCRRCNKKQKQKALEEIPHHPLHDLRHSYATLLATTKKYTILYYSRCQFFCNISKNNM